MNERLRVARVATIPLSFLVYKKMYELMSDMGCEFTFISSSGEEVEALEKIPRAQHQCIEIKRGLSPLRDLAAVWRLFRLFRQQKFDIIHSHTPKAGLVVALAGLLAGTPIRLHTFTGQRWATLKGLTKQFLVLCDKIVAGLNTHCFADSPSQVEFLIQSGIGDIEKLSCIHRGSFGGVDFNRFDVHRHSDRAPKRLEIGCPQDSIVLIFLGRLVKDKGIVELLTAFKNLHAENESLALLLVGPYEPDLDPLPKSSHELIASHPSIFSLGMKSDPEHYLGMSDILCLPSYREGFGTVVLEAAALGLPSIGTDIVGLKDAIVDGVTGLLCECRSTRDLEAKLKVLIHDEALRREMGNAAHERTRRSFDSQVLSEKTVGIYRDLVARNRTLGTKMDSRNESPW